MGYVIVVISLFLAMPCAAQESEAVAKFLEAAAIQTGIKKEVEQRAKDMYTMIVAPEYKPYFDAGVSLGNALVTQKIYIQKTWEF